MYLIFKYCWKVTPNHNDILDYLIENHIQFEFTAILSQFIDFNYKINSKLGI